MADERPSLDADDIARIRRAVDGLLKVNAEGTVPTARYVPLSDRTAEDVLATIDEVLDETAPKAS